MLLCRKLGAGTRHTDLPGAGSASVPEPAANTAAGSAGQGLENRLRLGTGLELGHESFCWTLCGRCCFSNRWNAQAFIVVTDPSGFNRGDQGPGSSWKSVCVCLSSCFISLSFQRQDGHYLGRSGLKHTGQISGQFCPCGSLFSVQERKVIEFSWRQAVPRSCQQVPSHLSPVSGWILTARQEDSSKLSSSGRC